MDCFLNPESPRYIGDEAVRRANAVIDNEIARAKQGPAGKTAVTAVPNDPLAFDKTLKIEKLVTVMAGGEKRDAVHLGNSRYVTVSFFEGKTLVHLRDYFRIDGQEHPIATKRGIAITGKQWSNLRREVMPRVTARLRQLERAERTLEEKEYLKVSLGGDVFVTVSQFQNKTYVHIRKHELVGVRRLIPTKKGIALTPKQWAVLSNSETELPIARMMSAALNDKINQLKRKREEEEAGTVSFPSSGKSNFEKKDGHVFDRRQNGFVN